MATPNTVSDQGVGPLPKHVSVVAVLFFSDTFHDIVLASLAFRLAQGSPELTALPPQPVEGWDQECVHTAAATRWDLQTLRGKTWLQVQRCPAPVVSGQVSQKCQRASSGCFRKQKLKPDDLLTVT